MSSSILKASACAALLAVSVPAAAAPALEGCPSLPANHVLNARVDALPVHARSAAWIANVTSGGDGASRTFYMDFGSGLWNGAPIGIPYVAVDGTQPKVPVSFTWWDESDAGPYPVPPNAPIEGVGPPDAGGDRHVLVVDRTNCKIYEMFNSWPQNGGTSWAADSGAVFDLNSNALRPETWTSADAAGLPMVPLLVRYDEVATGVIEHALRFTVPRTQRAYIWPARHYASTITDPNVAPMGARFRMKASVDITRFTGEARVIAQAMKTYGIILSDNGSAWFVNGAPDSRWNNTVLAQLKQLRGADFEAVDASSLMVDPNSGAVAGSTPPPPPPPPTPAATTTSLGSSLNPSAVGQAVTFTAAVASSAGVPTGSATFRSDSSTIAGCAGVALSGGSAACTTSALAAGTHTIVAEYAGNTSFAPSTSPALAQTVSGPAMVTITIARSGRGNGTVTASNGSINCGSDCTGQVVSGTSVTLTAAAKPNSVFQGWSGGGCSGTAPCTLAPTANVQVTATFRRKNE